MFYTCIINYIIEHNWTAFNIKLTIYFLGALLIPFIKTRPGTDEADLLDRIGTPPATWSACFHSHRPRPKQVARIAWQEAREVTNTNTQRPERMCMTYLKIFASENTTLAGRQTSDVSFSVWAIAAVALVWPAQAQKNPAQSQEFAVQMMYAFSLWWSGGRV